MKKISLLLILLSFFACSKNNDITVHIKNSGNLLVKVTDNLGAGIPDAKVKLYDSHNTNAYGYEIELESAKTNDKGEVAFKDLNPGNYTILVDTVKLNGSFFRPIAILQIAPSVDKYMTINATDYKGILDITLYYSYTYYSNSTPLQNGTILLIPRNNITYNLCAEQVKKSALIFGKSDGSGRLKLQIPCGVNFLIYASVDGKAGVVRLGEVAVGKDQVNSLNYTLYDGSFSN